MKNAIVTGGTKGIGFAITKMLLQEGYRVIATYAHDTVAATRAQKSLQQISPKISIVQCNQAKTTEISEFTAMVKKSWKHIDCLICNAGVTLRKEFEEISNEEWEEVMQVNVNSNVYLIRDLHSLLPPPPPYF